VFFAHFLLIFLLFLYENIDFSTPVFFLFFGGFFLNFKKVMVFWVLRWGGVVIWPSHVKKRKPLRRYHVPLFLAGFRTFLGVFWPFFDPVKNSDATVF